MTVDTLIERWLRTLSTGANICIAFSGGVDSSVLLYALAKARSLKAAPRLSAIHVHHGLSANASAWAEHCESVCVQLNVPLTVVRVSVVDSKRLGIEAAARSARYAALRAHAVSHDATIALAHHARDQAETVLLQLLRGAGPAGLAAMPEVAPPFARPLLTIEKSAIDAYAHDEAVRHIFDESNADSRFARNRLRHSVWPALAENFPAAERTLSRAATLQQESDELARVLAEIDLASCADAGHLVASKWRALSSVRRRNALRVWLERQKILTPSSERLRDWERQLLTENATQNLVLTHSSFTGSIRCYRDRIQYVDAVPFDANALSVGVRWSGESSVSFGAARVEFLIAHDRNDAALQHTNTQRLRPIAPGEGWVIRSRREKDKIRLSPNSGGVIVKNLFQQASIPPWLRGEWPIITCNGQIAAIPGVAVDYAFAANDEDEGYDLSVHFPARRND